MTEHHDENGRTIGYDLTVAEHERLLYAWAQSQFSEEELQRAEQESEEYTTEEVIRELEKT
jgi:hypothetical protein